MIVHVVGNVCVDRSFRLARLPRAGETLNATASHEGIGGKGANQAVAAARAGATVRFYAPIGSDLAGDALAEALKGEGIDLVLVRHPGLTDHSAILVGADGENVIATSATCAESFDPLRTTDLAASLTAGDILLMQGNLSKAVTDACFAAGRAARARTVLNPSPFSGPLPDLGGLTLIVANRPEAGIISGHGDPAAAARSLRARGAGSAIVTLGADGAMLAVRDVVMQRPACAARVVDTSGAGDCYTGTLVGLMAADWSLPSAMDAAAAAAAVAVERPGTLASFPSREDVAALLTPIAARRA